MPLPAGVEEEIHLLRDDFKERFMREENELHFEISEIKAGFMHLRESISSAAGCARRRLTGIFLHVKSIN